jgi:hypothetical protein
MCGHHDNHRSEESRHRGSPERSDPRRRSDYNGDFLRGLFWLILTPGMWLGTGGMLGWVCHVIASFTAHRRAIRKNLQLA